MNQSNANFNEQARIAILERIPTWLASFTFFLFVVLLITSFVTGRRITWSPLGFEPIKAETASERYDSILPSGAVIAFADAPTGSVKRNCTDLLGGWMDFTAADGRFILGAGQLNAKTYRAGEDGGETDVTLTVAQMPSHTHRLGYGPWGLANGKGNGNLETSGGSTNVDSTGGNQPHNNMPPYITLTYCKKD